MTTTDLLGELPIPDKLRTKLYILIDGRSDSKRRAIQARN
jgi:hypothetical protein